MNVGLLSDQLLRKLMSRVKIVAELTMGRCDSRNVTCVTSSNDQVRRLDFLDVVVVVILQHVNIAVHCCQ